MLDAFHPWERAYKRREPAGDAGDRVEIRGVEYVTTPDPLYSPARLVVASLDFGTVPAGWEEATALFEPKEFDQEYEPMTDAEIAAVAGEQVTASLDALAGNAGRTSPWTYVPPPARRTTRRRPDEAKA